MIFPIENINIFKFNDVKYHDGEKRKTMLYFFNKKKRAVVYELPLRKNHGDSKS